MSTYQHPVYTVKHSCGHIHVKQVLEGTPAKQKKVVKAMASMKCVDCLQKGSN